MLLLNLNIRNCTINYHSIKVIDSILDKNRRFRQDQRVRLTKLEHQVLTQQGLLLATTALRVKSQQETLAICKSEHEKVG